jgi:hypothetical protein
MSTLLRAFVMETTSPRLPDEAFYPILRAP